MRDRHFGQLARHVPGMVHTLAPILISFSRNVVSVQCFTLAGTDLAGERYARVRFSGASLGSL